MMCLTGASEGEVRSLALPSCSPAFRHASPTLLCSLPAGRLHFLHPAMSVPPNLNTHRVLSQIPDPAGKERRVAQSRRHVAVHPERDGAGDGRRQRVAIQGVRAPRRRPRRPVRVVGRTEAVVEAAVRGGSGRRSGRGRDAHVAGLPVPRRA